MPSVQMTAPGGPVTIPYVTGRIVATMMSAPAEAWITTDGSAPVAPSGSILANQAQKTIAGVTGAQVVLFPIQPGSASAGSAYPGVTGGSVYPIINIGSAGTPIIELEW